MLPSLASHSPVVEQHKERPAPAAPAPDATALALLEQADALRKRGALDEALRLAGQVLEDAERRGDALTEALALLSVANCHRYVPNLLTAIQLLNRAENYFRGAGDPRLAKALTFKGMVLSDLGDHTRALDLYRQALTQIDRNRVAADSVTEATTLGSVGVACTQLGEFEQAESAYRRAMDIFRTQDNSEGVGYLYNNLAILRVRSIQAMAEANRRGAAAEALGRDLFRFIADGLDINERAVGSAHLRALLLNTRGDGLRALGRAGEALADIEEALTAYRDLPSPRGIADVTADLGAALLELDRHDEALAHLRGGLAVALAHELKDHQRRLRRLLSEAHERAGDAVAALTEYKSYHMLERELHDRETQKKLQQLALREEIDKALDSARAQAEMSAELSAQNEALQRQTETLDRIAYEDALTGLPNRRRFDERTAALPAQLPDTFAIAVLDIDFFKKINDTWSHAMGDAVLQQVGRVLRAHCREQDLVARIGGEEFVLAMQSVDAAMAREACERVRAAVETHDWKALETALRVTVSVGLAIGDGRAAIEDLLKLADARLYESKRGGRNRVTAA